MRILISSGGTKVPIDPVRNISNSSSGRFGSELATAALVANMEVSYLTSSNGKSPFSENFDFYASSDWEDNANRFKQLNQFSKKYCNYYRESRYHNFVEYSEMLKAIIEKEQPQIVMLAAAVSDYLVSNYSGKKIRSSGSLNIHLESAPKLIHFIKQWSKETFLVGFKLLVDATDSELITAAMAIIEQHNIDLVVANNLSSIRRGAHEVILVEQDGSFRKYTQNLAASIIARSLQRWD